MTAFRCRLCNAHRAHSILVRDAKAGGPLPIAFCERCALVQQAALPDPESLRDYYAHSYRQDYKGVHTPKLKHVHRAGLTALSRLAFLRESGMLSPGMRLLDIGAGGGEFVYLARRAGFAAEGIEPHVGYSEFAGAEYGVQISTMALDELDCASTEVVTLFHVFEHLADPLAAMRRIHEVLVADGLLFIEVPNILQPDASPHNIWFKAHLFYYSRHTLAAAASRWFAPILTNDRGNLRVLFRKRAVPLDLPLFPTRDEVEHNWRRMVDKGWREYLLSGSALTKPWRRVCQMMTEHRLAGSPRSLLDALFSAQSVQAIRPVSR